MSKSDSLCKHKFVVGNGMEMVKEEEWVCAGHLVWCANEHDHLELFLAAPEPTGS
jgi:hypothetical protein